MENYEIIARVERALGIKGILDKLDRLPPTDLQSLLLALYERKPAKITAASLFEQYERNRFVCPSAVSQNLFASVERVALDLLPDKFNVVELSPVAPFGVNSVLTQNSQKKIMSTVRNLEVCADSTTALILECAHLRKKLLKNDSKSSQLIKLATNMRNIRLQNFKDIPGFTSHFKALTLATAGRDCGSEIVEIQSCLEHLMFYIDFLNNLHELGFKIGNINVVFSDIRITEKIIRNVDGDRKKLGLLSQNPQFDLFRHFHILFPAQIQFIEEISDEFVKKYGLAENIFFLSKIEEEVIKVLVRRSPHVSFSIDLGRIAGIGYYSDLCFKIRAHNNEDQVFPVADGGMNDWTQKLLQSRKERALASGMGTELLCQKFKS